MAPDQNNCRTSEGRYGPPNGCLSRREWDLWLAHGWNAHQREHDLAREAIERTATARAAIMAAIVAGTISVAGVIVMVVVEVAIG